MLTSNSVGAVGASVSAPPVTVVGAETLPAASFAVTSAEPPFVIAGLTGTLKLPSASAVPVPITSPAAFFTSTVAPGSVRPVTVVPSAFNVAAGAAGAVLSSAVTVAESETLPAGSLTVTFTVSPLVCAGFSTTSKSPLASAVPVPITLPAPSFTSTVEPGSALPVTFVPSSLTSKSVGSDGLVLSPAVTSAASETLPDGSFAVTSSASPLVCAGFNTTSKSPLASAVPVPITSPAAFFTSTVEPGSALPVTFVPSVLTSNSVGAAGAVLSPLESFLSLSLDEDAIAAPTPPTKPAPIAHGVNAAAVSAYNNGPTSCSGL